MRTFLKKKTKLLLLNYQRNFYISEELLAFKKDCATWSQSASRNLLRAEKTCSIPELSVDGC